jgi:hypothetical protein
LGYGRSEVLMLRSLLEWLLKHPEFCFWIIMAIMFFFLWRKNKEISKNVTEIKSKSFIMSVTIRGDAVLNMELASAIETLNDMFSKTSRLSGFGFIFSSIGAVFSAVFVIIKS